MLLFHSHSTVNLLKFVEKIFKPIIAQSSNLPKNPHTAPRENDFPSMSIQGEK